MTTWPGTIPSEFEQGGYQEAFANNTIKTSMDAGPPKRRRRTTASIKLFSGFIMMTDAEVALLETFYYDTIGEVNVFDFTHPRRDTTVQVVFAEPPSLTYISPNNWRVGLKFEEQP